MVEILEYNDQFDDSPFHDWFEKLNTDAARKVTTPIYRVGHENFSNVKGVGSGVFECKIDFGPGYRAYFGKDGERIVILLGGGRNKGSRTTFGRPSTDGKTTSRERSSRKKGTE